MLERWRRLRRELGWHQRSWRRQILGERAEPSEWQGLAAYRGLVQQAWRQAPLRPEVVADVWSGGQFRSAAGLPAFFNPSQREREGSSHHYGHDIQLKRHGQLPLVGRPLPFLLEHGLKVSEEAQFETPRRWARGGYLCMGPLRARWLRERYGCEAQAIGPWILYARPLLEGAELAERRQQLGKTLLVVLAHSWDRVQRNSDDQACIAAVEALSQRHCYRSVIWLRHWQDPPALPLPPSWIVACNGHRSNPWFLDSLRTLLELSDGLASNAFGTHLGYAVALDKSIHWLNHPAEQNLSALSANQAAREATEWRERERLSNALQQVLQRRDAAPEQTSKELRQLLEPYWGFAHHRDPQALHHLLSQPLA
ncbi:MAG: hypothetical protein RLZZ54_1270 [Cyanobacteriota bacterium]|jgi:hypothetical protein